MLYIVVIYIYIRHLKNPQVSTSVDGRNVAKVDRCFWHRNVEKLCSEQKNMLRSGLFGEHRLFSTGGQGPCLVFSANHLS